MERMVIFCMLFFCSSMALTTAPHKIAKYKQILKTIKQLETRVKDKDAELLHTPDNLVDDCLFTAVTCFQNGTLKLQPENDQVKPTFNQAINVLRKSNISNTGTHCESTCESYEKKTPKEFLKSFAKLITRLFKD